jgi:hypothetical protein
MGSVPMHKQSLLNRAPTGMRQSHEIVKTFFRACHIRQKLCLRREILKQNVPSVLSFSCPKSWANKRVT